MRPVDEQTILVTGATDGLGWALARDRLWRLSDELVDASDTTSPV